MTNSWEDLAKKLTGDPLTAIQAAAQNWVNVSSALVGITTVGGLIQGRDALAKLSPAFQILLVALFLIALTLSVTAIYLAAVAGEGTPGPVVLEEKAFTTWYRSAVAKASHYLKWSRQLTLITVILIVLGLGITWFAPAPSNSTTSGTNILILQKSGLFVCGALTNKAGNVSLTVNNTPMPFNDVATFTVVSNCP